LAGKEKIGDAAGRHGVGDGIESSVSDDSGEWRTVGNRL